jgi:hypothetical protein
MTVRLIGKGVLQLGRLACSPFLVAGIEICLYQRRPWRFSHKALRANTLSVFQGEVDHPITSYLNFTFPTEFALVSFHYVSLTVTSESLSMPQYLQVREFCGNGVDYQMSDYATQYKRAPQLE